MEKHKLKAIELVGKFKNVLQDEDTECGNEILCTLIAIKNAKICVDEILEEIQSSLNYSNPIFWKEVRNELDNL